MKLKSRVGLLFLHYLRILSKIQLAKINFFRRLRRKKEVVIVGITGSVGKTSTMYATAAALKDSFKVKYSEKANSESGIPLNILGLKMKDFSLFDWARVAILSPLTLLVNWQDYDVYVVEMGVDEPTEPKNMGYLLKIIQPQIGVFIGVTPVHSMQFEAVVSVVTPGESRATPGESAVLSAIADEKAKLIANLSKEGYAVLNFGDEFVKKRAKLTKAKIIKAEKVSIDFKDCVLPEVYEINFGLAVGIAEALGINSKKAITGIKKYFVLPPGRSSLIKGIKDTLIIDSSYNSSPKAVTTMLDLLDKYGKETKRKKIAVLGDMRELGSQSKIEHEKAARQAVKVADEIVLVGLEMKQYFLPKALKLGFVKSKINAFKTAWQAADFLKGHLKGKELLLVKGSQNTIFLEIVVKALMVDKSQAQGLLCRRGEFWEKKRRKDRITQIVI